MRKPILIIAITLAVTMAIAVGGGLWWRYRARNIQQVNASPYETEMIEALVRNLLREYGIRNAPACFLAFGESMTPPSWRFISRFSDCRRPAVLSYRSSVSPPLIGRHLELTTGRPGLIIQIVSFEEYIPGCFDVVVGISNLPKGHQRVVFRISHSTGEWTIIKRTPL